MAGMFDDLIPQKGNSNPYAGMFDDIVASPKEPTRTGMFDDLIPKRGGNPYAGVFDDLPDLPNSAADEAMASPEGQRLAAELRDKADRMLLEHAGPSVNNPYYAGASAAANTALLNVPRNLAAYARTFKDGGKSFEQEYSYLRDVDEAAARQNRGASVIGTLGGVGLQVAALPIAPAASVAGRMAQGAVLGAGQGGLSEFADTKELGQAARAAGIGAALGGVSPPVVEAFGAGVGATGRGVANLARPILNADAEAARRVSMHLAKDARVGGQELDDAALAAAQAKGQPAVVADMGGKATMGLARSAANTSPEARHALETATRSRFESQAPRVSQFVMDLGEEQDVVATREALKAEAARANRPAYAKAFAQGSQGSWHEGLAQLAQAQVVADAIKGATRTEANKAAAEGFRPVKNPFTVLESGEVTLTGDAKPTLQFWDAVKHNLDDKIGTLQRSGEKSAARDAIELRRQLVGYLDRDFPAYAEARSGAAQFFGAEDALDAGQKFVNAKGKNSEYMRAISKMSEPEKKLFADGFASELATRINELPDRRSVLNSIFNSPASRQRIQMALGPKKAQEFEAFMHIEGLMDRLRTEVSGGSNTTRQLVEAGLAGGAPTVMGGLAGAAFGEGDYKSISLGAIMGGLARRGNIKINRRVAQRVGEMLSSSDPEVFRRAIRMATKNRPVMDAIKKVDVFLGSASYPLTRETLQ